MTSYRKKYSREIEELLYVCKRLSDIMYVTSQGGNMSLKLEDNLILITPTLIYKADITPEDLVFIDLKGNKLEGERQPTSETPVYLDLYNERSDIISIIHCHPPYINVFAITKGKNYLMRPIFPETCVEVGPVPLIPYGESIIEQYTDKNVPFVKKYNAFLMENHGPFFISPDSISRTVQIVEILELSAMAIVNALSIGEIKELSREEVEEMDKISEMRKLKIIGAPGVNKSFMELYF
jgi:L-fuculose-phosphate aldolase